MPNKNKSPELIAEMLRYHNEGLNPYAISKKLGISKTTVEKYLIKSGESKHNRNDFELLKTEAKFLELLKTGLNKTMARRAVGLSYEIAEKVLKKHGIYSSNRADSAQVKKHSDEEIKNRLPDGVALIKREGTMLTLQGEDGGVYTRHLRHASKLTVNRNKSLQDIKPFLEALGYDLVPNQPFTTLRKPIQAVCRKCNKIRATRYPLFLSQDCPACTNVGVSKKETEIHTWLSSEGFVLNKFKFVPTKTKPKEIDIYVESLKFGIEFCGLYWHCENSPYSRGRNSHYDKMNEANKLGINLVTIFEDEWNNRQKQVKGYLLSKLAPPKVKVYARNCEVKEIQKDLAGLFIDQYHIQESSGKAKICLGIFYKDELMGVMTASPHHRQNNDVAVLDRLVFKSEIKILGGASKLLKQLKNIAKSMGFNKIISWSDNRWSQGGVYKSMGFTLETDLPPDYSYVKANRRFSKQSMKKSALEQQSGLTEKELRRNQGYDWIWDCGKKRWAVIL